MDAQLEKTLELIGGQTVASPKDREDPVAGIRGAGKRGANAARVRSQRYYTAKLANPSDVVAGFCVREFQVKAAGVEQLALSLAIPEEKILSVSSISTRTFHRRQQDKAPLSATESDRVLRIARVASEARHVFGDPDKANRWLAKVNRILGAPPIELLRTDAGSREVEAELHRIDHGDFA